MAFLHTREQKSSPVSFFHPEVGFLCQLDRIRGFSTISILALGYAKTRQDHKPDSSPRLLKSPRTHFVGSMLSQNASHTKPEVSVTRCRLRLLSLCMAVEAEKDGIVGLQDGA